MTLKAMEANYDALTDDDVIRMLCNTEGNTEFERGLILEAARRIEASAAAVQAEREACAKTIEDNEYATAGERRVFAGVIRARNSQEERKS